MALFQVLLQTLLVADPRRISHSGKLPNRESLPGPRRGGRDALGGTLSAP